MNNSKGNTNGEEAPAEKDPESTAVMGAGAPTPADDNGVVEKDDANNPDTHVEKESTVKDGDAMDVDAGPHNPPNDSAANENIENGAPEKSGGNPDAAQAEVQPSEIKAEVTEGKMEGNKVETSAAEVGGNEGGAAKKRKIQFSLESTVYVTTVDATNTTPIPPNIPPKVVYTDIYGRIPGKEPKYPVPCPNNCGRSVSSSRMALHLEKCIGLQSSRSRSRSSSRDYSSSSMSKGKVSKGGKASKQAKKKSKT